MSAITARIPHLTHRFATAAHFAKATRSRHIIASFSSAPAASDDGGGDGKASFGKRSQQNQSEDGANNNISMPQKQRSRRRTRRRSIQSLDGDESIPSLADFMHRAKVMKQYRSFVRLAQFVDGKDVNSENNKAGECRAALEEVRLSYKMGMKKDIDDLSKTMAFSEGERRLRELEAMVGYSADKRSKGSGVISPENYDADSWINIQDEEDPRGRVGMQWPWEQDDEKSK